MSISTRIESPQCRCRSAGQEVKVLLRLKRLLHCLEAAAALPLLRSLRPSGAFAMISGATATHKCEIRKLAFLRMWSLFSLPLRIRACLAADVRPAAKRRWTLATKVFRANPIGWLRAESQPTRPVGVLIAGWGGNERDRPPALVAGLAKMWPHTVGNVAIRGLGAELLDVPFAL
jgi:hypothetical protein